MKKRKIILALSSPSDIRLIEQELSEFEIVHTSEALELQNSMQFSLILCDLYYGEKLMVYIDSAKQNNKFFFPALLFLPAAVPPPEWFDKCFDDIIRIPLSKTELRTRINTFIRLREHSETLNAHSEEKYRTIFETTGTATMLVDKDTRILRANQECYRVFGYKEEELRGQSWTNYAAPESLAFMKKINVLRNENPDKAPKRYEVKLIHKNGSLRNVLVDVALIPHSNEKIVSMLDITEQRRMENELRDRELRNRLVANVVSDYTYIFNIENNQTMRGKWVNDAFQNTFGYTIPEIDKMGGWTALVHPEDLEPALQHAQTVLQGEAHSCEMRWKTKAGKYRWLKDFAIPIFDKNHQKLIQIIGASQDITEQKEAELALRESEERFRKLFEDHASIQLHIDPKNGQIIDANKAAEKFYGWTRHELQQKTIFDLNTLSKEAVINEMKKASSALKNHFEFQHRLKNGEIRDVEVFSSKITHKDKTFLHSIIYDITAQKTAELALEESEARFRSIYENATLGIYRTTPAGEILMANPALVKILGFKSSEELVQHNLLKSGFISKDARSRFLQLIEEKGAITGLESEWIKADGTTIYVRESARAIRDKKGQTLYYDGIAEDITELRQANMQIKESEEKFRKAFLTSPDAINITQIDGTYIEVNNGFTAITGYTRKDVIGKSSLEINIWVNQNQRKQLIADLKKCGSVSNLEAEFRCKNGHIVTGLMSASLITIDNKPHILSITRDISERKKMLQAIKQNELKYRTLQHNIPGMTYRAKGDWTVEIITGSEKLCNISAQEFQSGKFNWKKMIHPDDLDQVIRESAYNGTQQKRLLQEYRIITKSGATKWVEDYKTIFFGENGKVLYVDGIVFDVTRKKQTELDNLRFKLAIKNSPNAIFITNPRGIIEYVNPAFEALFGYNKAEIIGQSPGLLNPNGYSPQEHAEHWEKVLINNGFKGEIRNKTKQGRIIDIEVISNPIKDAQGHLIGFLSINKDITRQKQEEQQRQNLQRRLQNTMESISDGVVILNKELQFTYVNPQAATIIRHPIKNILGKSLFELFPEAKGSKFEKNLTHVLKAQRPLEQEIEYKTWQRWFRTRIYPTKEGLVTYFSDTTDKIQAERRLKTLIKAIEQSPLSMIITNSDGEIEFVNQKFTTTTQYLLSQVEGKKPRIFNPGHMPATHFNDMWAHIKKGEIWEGEFYNRRKDGSYYWESVTISAITDSDGHINNYIIVTEDITEWRQTELQLKLLSRSVEQSPVSVMITDKDGHFTYVNPKFKEVTGYSLQEVLGKTPRILKSGKHSQLFYKELWDTILAGKDWTGEILNKKKNGKLYWDNSRISPIVNSKGEITHFVAVQQDITQTKKLVQELIKAKEKAEESDRLKSAFLANMSHEIRTPMNGIIGFLDLLKDPNLEDETRNEFIQIINESGQRLLNTINDIIEISKIEAGSVSINLSTVNLSHLLQSLHQFFAIKAQEKGLQLLLNAPKTPLTIQSDKSKLESIITNLVNNAIKFTEKGEIELGLEIKPDKKCTIYVRDTGIGIKPENIAHIFDRFIQENLSLTRTHEGSGLGLAITRSYVEMLGGKIWVESSPGQGSCFFVEFNLSSQGSEALPVPKNPLSENIPEKEITLLIAEDDDIGFYYLERILKNKGYQIIRAKNGQEAVDLCANNPAINLVLMDIQMPVVNGYDATREILKIRPKLPIIAQTAYAFSEDREKVFESGCVDYLAKPISKQALLEKINRHVKRQGEKY